MDSPRGARVVELPVPIGGVPALRLEVPEPSGAPAPRLVSCDLLPGRGMNVWQITAWLADRGLTEVLASPSLEQAAKLFSDSSLDDFNGNLSFRHGGAWLVPFANRWRGPAGPEPRTIETCLDGRKVILPANWRGRRRDAEPHAMHGLLLKARADAIESHSDENGAGVTARFAAGDFGDHWVSRTDVRVSVRLTAAALEFRVSATNVGDERLPIGIGWHPYFRIPSGQRAQARLTLPFSSRAEVNNYDDVFPTGHLVGVAGTEHDFRSSRALDGLFLDDCFLHPVGSGVPWTVSLADPLADYALELHCRSPQFHAVQAYAPVDEAFVALEPQFNLADPFGKQWKHEPTGMQWLAPGESTEYAVDLTVERGKQ